MKKQKFSCADFTFPLLSHDSALDLISAMGFDGVDIGLFENRSHLQPTEQFSNTKGNALDLKNKLDDRQLKGADIFIQPSLDFIEFAANHYEPSRRQYSRDLFSQALEYASFVGSNHISALPGVSFGEKEEFQTSFSRCVQEQQWRVEEAKKAGLEYGIEAHVGSIVEDPVDALALVKAVPGLGLTLDYSHFVRMGKQDSEGDILLPYTNHFHARGASNGHLQTSVEESEIDFERILRKLSKLEYDGWITLEYCWTPGWEDCGRTDNVSETALLLNKIKKILETV